MRLLLCLNPQIWIKPLKYFLNNFFLIVNLQGAVASKFRCSGQTCVSANRFFIEESIFEEFLDKLKNKVETLKCGHGMEKNIDQGPLINKAAADKVFILKVFLFIKNNLRFQIF